MITGIDAFDQEMKKRDHRIVRYADDILILCRTEKAAQRALITATERLEKALAGWIIRRLRAIQLRLWKKPTRLHRRLRPLGKKPPFKFIKMNSWRNSQSPLSCVAMQNQWFEERGLYSIEHINTGWLALSAFRK
jgi:RNA-directed DNA polymerase